MCVCAVVWAQEEEDESPFGLLKQRWEDVKEALNCYGPQGPVVRGKEWARDNCSPAARSCMPGAFD